MYCIPYLNHNAKLADSTQKYWTPQDVYMMQQALKLAEYGSQQGEVPVGAVLTHENRILATGYNQPIKTHDPTAHAEIIAIRNACQRLNNYRLPIGSTLYVTLEPCTMCVGSLIHARVTRLVFATFEPRAGMISSQINLIEQPFYNHQIQVQYGLMAYQSSQMLKAFFRQRRKK